MLYLHKLFLLFGAFLQFLVQRNEIEKRLGKKSKKVHIEVVSLPNDKIVYMY